MIKMVNVNKSFGPVNAVVNVSFRVEDGQALAMIGPSGSGKTTLLRLLSGLDEPDSGQIFISDIIANNPEIILPPYSRNLGVVFQRPCLWPHMTVKKNISFGLSNWKKSEANVRYEELIHFAKLEGLENRFPHQLSGGEAQRVALARAIAPKPSILLLDEPFSNLDHELQQEMINLIRSLQEGNKITIIIVSHDHQSLNGLCEKVIVLQKGCILYEGFWENYYHWINVN